MPHVHTTFVLRGFSGVVPGRGLDVAPPQGVRCCERAVAPTSGPTDLPVQVVAPARPYGQVDKRGERRACRRAQPTSRGVRRSGW
jgi:hypothetical protein